jgi:hypothetical protein
VRFIGEKMQFPRWLTARAKIKKHIVRAIVLEVFAILFGMNYWFGRALARFVEDGWDSRDERTAFCRAIHALRQNTRASQSTLYNTATKTAPDGL